VTQPVDLEVEVDATAVIAVRVDQRSAAVSPEVAGVSLELQAESPSVGLQVDNPVDAHVYPNAAEQVLVVAIPGIQGPRGFPGTGARIYGETPTGAMNGTNTIFTLVHQYQPGTVTVFRNGLREYPVIGYTESGPARITMADPPLADDTIAVDYLVA
jgi:hypothetical protein